MSLPGDYTGVATLPTQRTITAWPFLTEVDVSAPGAGAIVALGNSITDGAVTTLDANAAGPTCLHCACRRRATVHSTARWGLSIAASAATACCATLASSRCSAFRRWRGSTATYCHSGRAAFDRADRH